MRPEQLKPRKSVIRWTDEEWDKLAQLVVKMRRNSQDSICVLANRAQAQFPKDRQRPGLTTVVIQPLIDRVHKIERAIQARSERVEELEAKLSFYLELPTSKDELRDGVLESVTDDELRQKFSGRFMSLLAPIDVASSFSADELMSSILTADLAAVLARRLVGLLERPIEVNLQAPQVTQNKQVVRAAQKPVTNGKKKRIAIVGLSGDEWRHIRDAVGDLCDLQFIAVDHLRKENVPRNADKIIMCANCVSHKHRTMVRQVVEPRNVFDHYFGNRELVKKIESVCRGETVAKK